MPTSTAASSISFINITNLLIYSGRKQMPYNYGPNPCPLIVPFLVMLSIKNGANGLPFSSPSVIFLHRFNYELSKPNTKFCHCTHKQNTDNAAQYSAYSYAPAFPYLYLAFNDRLMY